MTEQQSLAEQTVSKASTERRVILLLATLLVVNPTVVFLLTGSVLMALGIASTCVALMLWLSSVPRLKLLTAYVFNFLFLISLFAHAEVILLYGFPEYVIENLYTIQNGFYFNRPFLEQTFFAKEYTASYRTNAQGFRIGSGQDPGHAVEQVDWLVLGDSYSQGAQVEFEDLYTQKLYERFPDKIILNVGISGFGIGHEYNYFVNEGYKYEPELVILQLCSFNDFMQVEPRLVGFTDRLMTYSAFIRFLLADIRFQNPAELPLGRWTEPFYPDAKNNADYNIFYAESSPTKDADLESFGRYLTLFRDAVEDTGAELLVVLIPTKEQIAPRYYEEVIREFAIDPASLDMRRPNDFLGDLAQSIDVRFVDLLSAFQQVGATAYFDYDEHLSIAGHDVMANAIGDELEATHGPSDAWLLSREIAGDRYPSFAPNGLAISYQSYRSGNMELFLATPDFSQTRRLTFNDVDESHPMLSRDTSRLIFTEGSQETLRTNVVVMNVDGSGRTSLTPRENTFGAIPVFAPSNRQVAYAEWSVDPDQQQYSNPRIVTLDVFTGEKLNVTSDEVESWRPVFSPDETRLAYIKKPDGTQFDLYLYEFESGTEQQVTNTPFDEWDPQFSPDGQTLVYAARSAGNWDLFLLDLASGATVQLTQTKGDEWDPSFAPHGESIVFAGRFGFLEAIFGMSLPSR